MRTQTTIALLATLLLVTACNKPTTSRPFFSADEVSAEQESQKEAAVKNPFPPLVEPIRPTKAMKNRLQAIANRVSPQGTKLCHEMVGGPQDSRSCSFSMELEGDTGVNAFADGKRVVVSGPMMEFARSDTHLAFVVAHELSHNIMEHPQSSQTNVIFGAILGTVLDVAAASQGANTSGQFGKAGAQMGLLSYSTDFEQEADYLALYILARAGYPIEQAPNFWRAMSQYEPKGIYARTTHPTNAERFVAMNKTIAEIRAKQRAREPLLPNIRPKDA